MDRSKSSDKPKILLLEPDDRIRELVSHILDAAGFTVVATTAGNEAVRAWQKHAFHAMVIDVSIRGSVLETGARRGMGFLHFLQRNAPEALKKVVLTTALSDHDMSGGLPPVHAVLRKPFDVNELRAAVLACSKSPAVAEKNTRAS